MTATVTALPPTTTTQARRQKLVKLAEDMCCGAEWVSPVRLLVTLRECASPALTGAERRAAWVALRNWHEIWCGLKHGTGTAEPSDALGFPGPWDMAEVVAEDTRNEWLDRLVGGGNTNGGNAS